jgi:hypothetical protein
VIDRDVNAVCAMKNITRQWDKASQRLVNDDVCRDPVHKVIHGVPLCWVHFRSVEAGIRPLPVAERKVGARG